MKKLFACCLFSFFAASGQDPAGLEATKRVVPIMIRTSFSQVRGTGIQIGPGAVVMPAALFNDMQARTPDDRVAIRVGSETVQEMIHNGKDFTQGKVVDIGNGMLRVSVPGLATTLPALEAAVLTPGTKPVWYAGYDPKGSLVLVRGNLFVNAELNPLPLESMSSGIGWGVFDASGKLIVIIRNRSQDVVSKGVNSIQVAMEPAFAFLEVAQRGFRPTVVVGKR